MEDDYGKPPTRFIQHALTNAVHDRQQSPVPNHTVTLTQTQPTQSTQTNQSTQSTQTSEPAVCDKATQTHHPHTYDAKILRAFLRQLLP